MRAEPNTALLLCCGEMELGSCRSDCFHFGNIRLTKFQLKYLVGSTERHTFAPSKQHFYMELRTLLSFVAAAEAGSMVAAAKACHLTNSAISKHVKELEDELGAKLLTRRKNDVRLTEYGEALVENAKNIIRESREAKDRIASMKGELTGDLCIGAGCFVEPLIGLAVAEFMKKYPKVKIRMQYNYAHELNRQLKSKELDIVFSMNQAYASEGIETVPCFKFQLYAVMSQDNPLTAKEKITFDDVAKSRVIIPDTGKRELATIQQYTNYNITRIIDNCCCYCNNANAILNGIGALNAISVMPKEYVMNRTNLAARQIIGFENVLTSYAHWMKDAPVKESVRALMEIIRKQNKKLY